MIREFQISDTQLVMQLWLAVNEDAHSFVAKEYWQANFEEVEKQLLKADIFVYDYFVAELENVLPYVFGLKSELDEVGNEHTEYQRMLHNIVMAVSYKAYIDKYYADLRQEN